MIYFLGMLLPACTPDVSTPPLTQNVDSASEDTSNPTDVSPPMEDLAPVTVEVAYEAWEEDRQCWAIRVLERDESVWGSWVDNLCDLSIEQEVVYWMADGHCGHWPQALAGECSVGVDFGTWIQACDSTVHSCCTYNGVRCQSDPYYQP